MIDGIAEEASRDNNIGDLYLLTKQIVQANTNTVTAVNKHGKLLINEKEILERWKEYLKGCSMEILQEMSYQKALMLL